MEEIKIGEYVRTKDGIAKIINIKENPNGKKTIYELNKKIINIEELKYGSIYCSTKLFEGEMTDMFDTHFGDEKVILKNSANIIDLIKEGDIIEWELKNRGYYGINEVINRFGKIGVYATEADCIFELNMLDIKSIVTKEQFEDIKYEV